MNNLLKPELSHCEERQKIIVSRDRGGCEHRALNSSECLVRQFYLDEEIIPKDQESCDRLVLNIDNRRAYFIELKGTDIQKAIDQIEASEKYLQQELNQYKKLYRIIYRTGSHRINSRKTIQWKESKGCLPGTSIPIAIIKSRKLEESIV